MLERKESRKQLTIEQLEQFKIDILFCADDGNLKKLTPADRDIVAGAGQTFVKYKTVTPGQAEMVAHVKAKLEGTAQTISWGEYDPDLT